MKRYIFTVGPSLLHTVPLSRIHKDNFIYRINGAHGTSEDIAIYIERIRAQVQNADILMDLPGNKIRTKDVGQIKLVKDKEFSIPNENFNYPEFYQHIKPGMTVWANDSIFEFVVNDVNKEKITFLSKSNGILINNKGVHVRDMHGDLPFLFEKDRRLIKLANEYHIPFVGLSFVRTGGDIEEAKAFLDPAINIISKVETIDAVNNLNDILRSVEYILVDRGDLSTDIGIENIPHYQNYIIEKALYFEKRVFLATQILKNMETKPIPTIAEIDDLYNISKKGIYGIQLSEETAVGEYIEECIAVLDRMEQNIIKEKLAGLC